MKNAEINISDDIRHLLGKSNLFRISTFFVFASSASKYAFIETFYKDILRNGGYWCYSLCSITEVLRATLIAISILPVEL